MEAISPGFRLNKEARERVENAFGGPGRGGGGGHLFDLMAFDSLSCPISRLTLSLSQRGLTCSLKICFSLRTCQTLTFSRLLDWLALFQSSSILSAFPLP